MDEVTEEALWKTYLEAIRQEQEADRAFQGAPIEYRPHALKVLREKELNTALALGRYDSRNAPKDSAFYVSMCTPCHHSLLLGPYTTIDEAVRNVRDGKELAIRINPSQASFASFGTCSLPPGVPHPCGVLNTFHFH